MLAAFTGSPQVIKSPDERDQGAIPASNAAAIRSDASFAVMVGSPLGLVVTADEGFVRSLLARRLGANLALSEFRHRSFP